MFHTAEGGLRKQTNGMKKFTHFSHYNKTGSGGKLDIGAHALVKLRKILFHESLFPPLAVIDLQWKKKYTRHKRFIEIILKRMTFTQY